MATDDELKALKQAHAKKFDELCAFLAAQYGMDPNPANLSSEQRDDIVEEVEELIDNWDMATFENWDLEDRETQTKVQRLFAELDETGERIKELELEKYQRGDEDEDEDEDD